jgi:hypothetical protein
VRLGVPELIILTLVVLVPVLLFITVHGALSGRRAKKFGYRTTREYLRAAPRTDEEKRDAADLALKGLVVCMLGFLFAPFVLAGLVPLFYGGRKLVYTWMGLGLVDDGHEPGA